MASPEVQSGLFNRVAGFPVVQSAYGKVTDVYSAGKEYSRLVKFACDAVESSVQLVASTAQPLAQPIVGKFEGPLAAADEFACRQLDRLEETVPMITATPEEMVTESKRFIREKLSNGTETLSNTAIANLVGSRVDRVLTATETVVDYILPEDKPSVSKVAEEPSECMDAGRLDRLGAISTKVSARVRVRAVNHLSIAQKKAQQALEKLQATLEVMEQAQEQLKAQRARVAASVEDQAQWLRSSVALQSQKLISAVEGGAISLQTTAQNALSTTVHLPGGTTVELQTLLDHARRLSNASRTAFATAASVAQHLPTHVQTRAQEALNLAKELTQLIHNAALGNELSRSVMERASFLIAGLRSSTTFFSDYIRSFVQPSVVQLNEEKSSLSELPVDDSSVRKEPLDSTPPPVVKANFPDDEEEEEEEEEISDFEEAGDSSVPANQPALDTDV